MENIVLKNHEIRVNRTLAAILSWAFLAFFFILFFVHQGDWRKVPFY